MFCTAAVSVSPGDSLIFPVAPVQVAVAALADAVAARQHAPTSAATTNSLEIRIDVFLSVKARAVGAAGTADSVGGRSVPPPMRTRSPAEGWGRANVKGLSATARRRRSSARLGARTRMAGEGFEPSKAEPRGLQPRPFDRSGTPPPA